MNTTNTELQSNSLWLLYKSRVWEENSPQTAIVHNAMRILRSIRCNFNYISTPITSGKVMYNNHYDIGKVISINILDALNFADELKNVKNLLLPAELMPTNHYKWEQEHFQALWLSIIGEKCENVYMNDGWEYSNGCAEELVHTFQLRLGPPKHSNLVFFNTKEDEKSSIERMKNIRVFNRNQEEIFPQDALNMLNNSISDLQSKDIKVPKLERARNYLQEIIDLI